MIVFFVQKMLFLNMYLDFTGQRESSASACSDGLFIDVWWNNRIAFARDIASSSTADSRRGRRVWERLGFKRLLPLHSDKVRGITVPPIQKK